MSFLTRLSERAREVDSLLCIGLDPHPEDLPSPTAEAAGEFCFRIVQATTRSAAAYKPNIAFFEAYAADGLRILKQVIDSVPEGIPVILDAKRGDIASTAEAYAKAVFEAMGAQAVTINPYLGHDALRPFIADPERGVFLLCKTSNPGASDLQDLTVVETSPTDNLDRKLKLYEKVALLAQEWNIRDNLGLVVGATYPEALERVRDLAHELWILTPGVGMQRGDLESALRAGLRPDGLGLLIPVSRWIARSPDPRKAAEELRVEINKHRQELATRSLSVLNSRRISKSEELSSRLADDLLEAGCIKFGQFTLKSGLLSPIYIDLRQLVSFARLLRRVAQAYISILKDLKFNRLAGIPYAGLPIATAISLESGWPQIYPRKDAKSYGTKAEIEGVYNQDDRIVIIDDLTTTGGSKFEAIEKLTSAGLIVEDIVVLIDRQSGAAEALTNAGFKLHAAFTLSELLDHYERSGKVPQNQILEVRKFLSEGK